MITINILKILIIKVVEIHYQTSLLIIILRIILMSKIKFKILRFLTSKARNLIKIIVIINTVKVVAMKKINKKF